MKYTILAYSLAIVVLVSGAANSQDKFMVMSVKGKAELSEGKSGKWSELKVGRVLKQKDVVRTSYGSYVKFMVNEDRLITVDENTTRTLSEFTLTKKKDGNKSSTTGRLLSYVASQMKPSKDEGNKTVFGAVRGDYGIFTSVFPRGRIITDVPEFQWVDNEQNARYEFLLLDDQFKPVAKKEVSGNGFVYSDMPPMETGKEYHWRVTRISDGTTGNIVTFQIDPSDSVRATNTELAEIHSDLKSMNADAETVHWIIGMYFEKKGLLTDAFNQYHALLKLSPEQKMYKERAHALLYYLKLTDEEELLLK